MKLLIASDIHGSEFYCQKLIEQYQKIKPNKMLLLGDILYHGARNNLPEGYNPKGVIKLLNGIAENIICVRGNCDSEVDQMVLDFDIMADYTVIYDGKTCIYATHGHKINADNPSKTACDFLVCGHFHVPKNIKQENFTYINVGSVSLPKGNSSHSFVVYENGNFEFKKL